MQQISLTDRTIGGLLWVFSGTAAQSVLSLAVMVVLARLLSPKEFGIVGAALVIVGFSEIFSQIGIGPAIVQRPDLTPAHVRVSFTLSVAMGLLVGFVIFAAAPLATYLFRIPELEKVVRMLALIFPITGSAVVCQALLQREMQFKRLAAIGLGSYVLGYGLVGVALALLGRGVWALVWAHLAQAIIHTLILLLVQRKVIGFSLRWREMGQLLNFGTGFSLAKIANYSANQADNLVVGRWLGAEALGIYGRAYQFLVMPANLVGSVVDKVLFPAMASVQHDKVRLGRAYLRAVAIIAMLTLPLSGLLIALAPEIVLIILGGQWSEVVLPFQVLAAVLVFRTSYKISDSLARATGAVYRRAWRQCIYAGAVFGNAWLGHFWGLFGVACGVAAAIVLNYSLMLHLSARLVDCSWSKLAVIHLRYLALAVGVGGTVGMGKVLLEGAALHPAFVIAGGGGVATLLIASLWLLFRPIFGEEGLWVSEIVKRHGQAAAIRLGI